MKVYLKLADYIGLVIAMFAACEMKSAAEVGEIVKRFHFLQCTLKYLQFTIRIDERTHQYFNSVSKME